MDEARNLLLFDIGHLKDFIKKRKFRKESICHICGTESDWYCEQCGEIVCEGCTVPFTNFNQPTETQCVECGGINDDYRSGKKIDH